MTLRLSTSRLRTLAATLTIIVAASSLTAPSPAMHSDERGSRLLESLTALLDRWEDCSTDGSVLRLHQSTWFRSAPLEGDSPIASPSDLVQVADTAYRGKPNRLAFSLVRREVHPNLSGLLDVLFVTVWDGARLMTARVSDFGKATELPMPGVVATCDFAMIDDRPDAVKSDHALTFHGWWVLQMRDGRGAPPISAGDLIPAMAEISIKATPTEFLVQGPLRAHSSMELSIAGLHNDGVVTAIREVRFKEFVEDLKSVNYETWIAFEESFKGVPTAGQRARVVFSKREAANGSAFHGWSEIEVVGLETDDGARAIDVSLPMGTEINDSRFGLTYVLGSSEYVMERKVFQSPVPITGILETELFEWGALMSASDQ